MHAAPRVERAGDGGPAHRDTSMPAATARSRTAIMVESTLIEIGPRSPCTSRVISVE